MDEERTTRLKLLLEDVKRRGFVYYKELGDFFPDTYMGGPELDEVLSQLERAGIAILADPKMVPDKEPAQVIFSDRLDDLEIVDDPLQVYLREVSKVSRLTSEHEIQLAESIANKGTDADRAETQLVEANLWLVVTIAQQYRVPGIHIWICFSKETLVSCRQPVRLIPCAAISFRPTQHSGCTAP
jgi:Sigma-70 factor, region 1.1/Sigma-70 factor, region 1.2